MGKRYPVLRFRPGELRPSRTHITRLFAIGVPMGLQYSVTAIGTIVVQTAVKGLGAVSIAPSPQQTRSASSSPARSTPQARPWPSTAGRTMAQ